MRRFTPASRRLIDKKLKRNGAQKENLFFLLQNDLMAVSVSIDPYYYIMYHVFGSKFAKYRFFAKNLSCELLIN